MSDNVELKDMEPVQEVQTPAETTAPAEPPAPQVFTASLIPTESVYRSLGEAVVYHRRIGIASMVFAIIFAVLAAGIFGEGEIGAGLFYLVLSVICWISYIRRPYRLGRASWKNRNRMLDFDPTNYRFDGRYIYDNHPLSASTTDFRLLTETIETEEAFFLFVNGTNAHIIPKEKLAGGTVDEFRRCLVERSAKPVHGVNVRRQHRRRILIAVLAVVLAVVIGFVGCASGEHTHVMKLSSGDTIASITLPNYLEGRFFEDDSWYVSGRAVNVSADYCTLAELGEYYKFDITTWEDYRLQLTITEDIPADAKWVTLKNGVHYTAYEYEKLYSAGYTAYAVYWTEDGCFEWVFSTGNAEKYEKTFREWADSIVLEEAKK